MNDVQATKDPRFYSSWHSLSWKHWCDLHKGQRRDMLANGVVLVMKGPDMTDDVYVPEHDTWIDFSEVTVHYELTA